MNNDDFLKAFMFSAAANGSGEYNGTPANEASLSSLEPLPLHPRVRGDVSSEGADGTNGINARFHTNTNMNMNINTNTGMGASASASMKMHQSSNSMPDMSNRHNGKRRATGILSTNAKYSARLSSTFFTQSLSQSQLQVPDPPKRNSASCDSTDKRSSNDVFANALSIANISTASNTASAAGMFSGRHNANNSRDHFSSNRNSNASGATATTASTAASDFSEGFSEIVIDHSATDPFFSWDGQKNDSNSNKNNNNNNNQGADVGIETSDPQWTSDMFEPTPIASREKVRVVDSIPPFASSVPNNVNCNTNGDRNGNRSGNDMSNTQVASLSASNSRQQQQQQRQHNMLNGQLSQAGQAAYPSMLSCLTAAGPNMMVNGQANKRQKRRGSANSVISDCSMHSAASAYNSGLDDSNHSSYSYNSSMNIIDDASAASGISRGSNYYNSTASLVSRASQFSVNNPRIKASHIEKWNERYAELQQFVQQHGHACVPLEYKENPSLSHWVKRQRCQYKLKQAGSPSSMTDDRQFMLEQVNFVWNSHEAAWHEKFQELYYFRQEFKHCNVPSKYVKNPSLAVWVKCQRRQYKLFKQGAKSNISLDRIQKLTNLGFVWLPREANKAKYS